MLPRSGSLAFVHTFRTWKRSRSGPLANLGEGAKRHGSSNIWWEEPEILVRKIWMEILTSCYTSYMILTESLDLPRSRFLCRKHLIHWLVIKGKGNSTSGWSICSFLLQRGNSRRRKHYDIYFSTEPRTSIICPQRHK